MLRRLHDRLGTAGLVIAVIALVAALTGTALAANGALSSKQQKEVTKIAKRYAGKPGAPGSAGANGAPGPKGDTGAPGSAGKDGANGTNGTNGTNGVSVQSGPEAPGPECTFGGAKFTAANGTTYACNGAPGVDGEDGETGFTETLPVGKTETGAWAFTGTTADTEGSVTALQFNIPLAADLDEDHVVYIPFDSSKAHCPGTPDTPKAESGYLCVYERFLAPANATFGAILDPVEAVPGADAVGAMLMFTVIKDPGVGFGVWAVTG